MSVILTIFLILFGGIILVVLILALMSLYYFSNEKKLDKNEAVIKQGHLERLEALRK
jgi:uncharacterized membrane protein YqiK